ncbi:hypothetical protein [Streptomyces buecherae]|uniref:Pre-toxin TG domain-containing protein n=1 Tax=Streptomyces buecherae TaxID=2763006 RepID=A0A7H8N2R6_9ACTN|nr:hypothetical protein [Streptomyces buecherae]QKW48686.1 hypothetical protein HUT08_03035 [Streptomyces buecherae]
MPVNLGPFREQLAAAELRLFQHLLRPRTPPDQVAVARRTVDIMHEDMASGPALAQAYAGGGRGHATGPSGPERWYATVLQRAGREVSPPTDDALLARKHVEYLTFAGRLRTQVAVQQSYTKDPRNGVDYLITPNERTAKLYMTAIADELMTWFRVQPYDTAFLRLSAEAGYYEVFLPQRPDVVALLRVAQRLPPDVDRGEIPIERPLESELFETAVGSLPLIGSMLAAYEAYEGRDLFGYRLGDIERAVLLATLLLPFAGRVIKAGRLMYTESRLARLYGHEGAAWRSLVLTADRMAVNGPAVHAVRQAEEALRTEGRVTGKLGQEAAGGLPKLLRGGGGGSGGGVGRVAGDLDDEIEALLRRMTGRHPVLEDLDVPAVRRVLSKGPYVNNLKGQLLEELVENRIVPWLRLRTGAQALGVRAYREKLEFVPGHLISDRKGAGVTDGILAIRRKSVLHVEAIFEAKAGFGQTARGLSRGRGGLSSLKSAEDRATFLNLVKNRLRNEREIARLTGKPYDKTLDDLIKEYQLAELGGQFRRDVERLSPSDIEKLEQIYIGEELIRIGISPTRVKLFAVVPGDLPVAEAKIIHEELLADHFQYVEIIGADTTRAELNQMAGQLKGLAQRLAEEKTP